MTENLSFLKAVTAIGVLLCLIGIFFFAFSGASSFTSLIPTVFGAGFIALAYFSARRLSERVALILIALLAAFGAFGSAQGSFDLLRFFTGADIARPLGALAQSLMFLACLPIVWMSIRRYQKNVNQARF